MRRPEFTIGIIVGVIVLHSGGTAEACGRGRACHARHHRAVCQTPPAAYPVPAYPMSVAQPAAVASPQTAYVGPVVTAQPAVSAQPAVTAQPVASQPATVPPTPSETTQPRYNYAAADQAQPAYYYTYDNSGKLVVSQWMDFLFRGGRAEGMPRPPLPIVGAFRSRQ